MKQVKFYLLAMFMMFAVADSIFSQVTIRGGRPYSYSNVEYLQNIESKTMPLIDRDALLAEDLIEAEEGLPFRFASNIDLNVNMNNSGKWTVLKNGDKLWQLEIYSQDARSISFIYDNFRIPKGATYYIYNPLDTHKVTGGYTYKNNSTEVEPFSSGLLLGSRVVLEYYEPKVVEFSGNISMSKTTHGYKNVLKHIDEFAIGNPDKGYGDSEPCQNNINCPEWADWQDVMKSVAMITVDLNTRICTGALINNYNEDEKYYFLTADHCTNGYSNTEAWVMYFRYEQADCDSAYDGNLDGIVNGGTTKASGTLADGDYLLLELTPDDDTIPSEYDIYYAGWSALTTEATSSVTIHHPEGDVKKISIDTTSVEDGYGVLSNLWKTYYTPALTGSGSVEGGSSGAPLFDQNYRIIGQHSTSSFPDSICTDTSKTQGAGFGKFEAGYDDNTTDSTTYLKYWLDPTNTGITTLDGLYPNASCCVGSTRGNVDNDVLDAVDISDLIYIVDFIFTQGPVPACEEEGDVDGSGEIDISDLTYIVDFIFLSGPPPPSCP